MSTKSIMGENPFKEQSPENTIDFWRAIAVVAVDRLGGDIRIPQHVFDALVVDRAVVKTAYEQRTDSIHLLVVKKGVKDADHG